MPLTFVKSQRGKDHLVYNGYRYNLNKGTWYCVDRRRGNCQAKAYTTEDEIQSFVNEHNHVGDAALIEKLVVQEKIRVAAQNTFQPTKLIVSKCILGVSKSAAVKLPAIRSMARYVRKIRQPTQFALPVPASLSCLSIPECYKYLENGERFLLHDSGPDSERMLIFSTMENLNQMSVCTDWFSDGTFKVAPMLFDQVLNTCFIINIEHSL